MTSVTLSLATLSPATLLQFAAANDAAAATSKKLEKQRILADYFSALAEADLPTAVRFASGRIFAANDQRALGASGAAVSEAVVPLLRMEAVDFRALAVRSGEIGEALAIAWPQIGAQESPLTLHELEAALIELSSTGNLQTKRDLLRQLFSRCTAGREAAYVAKIIFGDLRTGVKEGVLQAAVAQAFGKTTQQIVRCDLLVGDLGQVAVLAKQDRLDSARFALFHPIQFMLATPQESPEQAAATMNGRMFYAEHKLDGIRAHVHKQGDGQAARVQIYSRTMDRSEESFPDVVHAISAVPGDFLLDGEIVPWRNGRILPFANIQKRLGRRLPTAKVLRDHPAVFIAFDLLYLNGELLIDAPLSLRRARLDAMPPSLLRTATEPITSADQIEQAFAAARTSRNEGLVLKDPDSIYAPGRRGQVWLKLKTHLPTLDCVVTAAEYGHGKRRGVLSDYTFAVWDRESSHPAATLVNIGKAYSGVTDEEIDQLTERFLRLSLGSVGRVHRVEPTVVFEIAFDQIQKSDRHASGFAFRFPRIKRIRWDKRPVDADTLERVREIFTSLENTAHLHGDQPPPEPTLFDGM